MMGSGIILLVHNCKFRNIPIESKRKESLNEEKQQKLKFGLIKEKSKLKLQTIRVCILCRKLIK